MATENFAEGIAVTLPDDFEVTKPRAAATTRSAKLPMSGAVAMPTDSGKTHDNNVIIDALKNSGLELLREIEIKPIPQAAARRKRSSATSKVVEFAVDLAQGENAVLLLEQDGLYLWKYASETQPAVSTRRRGAHTEATQKRVVFRVDVASAPPSTKRQTKRDLLGEIKDFVWGKVKAYVLKVVASASVELAKKYLERNISRGFINIASTSPAQWKLLTDLKELNLPTDRAARILLLVHGTFSSTVGGFGALGGTPWGEALLSSALKHYDAIIGFNHATLSEDPLQNARLLLEGLHQYHWPVAPAFDVIAHSRGGLVVRALLEKLLPQHGWEASFNRIIFVACTNAGTLLAEPENWESLINLYTNLVAGTCRVLGLISPQSKAVSIVLSDVIESVGSFVQYCADSAVTDRVIPGLSAMEPDGEFISDINQLQSGQPTLANSYYCAITSEFTPRLLGDHEPQELPKRFLDLLVGGFMGQLMKEANDLVVNTKSMGAIDTQLGNYIKERYDFGENPQVYHTNYFTRPEVANALARWLSLPPIQLRTRRKEVKKRDGTENRSPRPSTAPLTTLATNYAAISPLVDTDIILANATSPVGALREEITRHTPSYVVVRRSYQGRVLHYAFAGEEALKLIGTKKGMPIIDAFNLHETDESTTQDAGAPIALSDATPGRVTTQRGVITVGDVPVGVVPEKRELPDAKALAAMARQISDPKTDRERILFRRAMPTFQGEANGGTADAKDVVTKEETQASGPPAEEKVTCHFHAEMDVEVAVKKATTLIVTVSREMIDAIDSDTSAKGEAKVSTDKKLLIRVIPKSNFIVIDENDGRVEIEVPKPKKPTELLFDLRATEEGDGEVWVMVRQGAVSIVKLVLKPKVVKTRSLSSAKTNAETDASEPPPLSKPLHQLWIEEIKTESGFIYKFDIYSEGLRINRQFKSNEVTGDREKYVADLYQSIEDRWVSIKQDTVNFTQEMRAFGVDLFDELIPKELQQMLWTHRNEFDSIQVISSEPFIPWEVVHLRDPNQRGMPDEMKFLGQMGLVRWLEGAGENGWPPETIKLREGRARYVIPCYPHPDYELPEAEKETKFLAAKFAAKAVTPESGAVRDLISKPGQFDLLHFACHGGAESKSISGAKLLMEGRLEHGKYVLDPFLATVAAKFSNLKADDNTPMVVLNACQAGRAGYKLTGIGGFASAFLTGGAGVFVGALWSVGDSPARTFTETLYKTLLDDKNLSEATVAARQAAQKAGEATWLAYVVYGNPHLKISR